MPSLARFICCFIKKENSICYWILNPGYWLWIRALDHPAIKLTPSKYLDEHEWCPMSSSEWTFSTTSWSSEEEEKFSRCVWKPFLFGGGGLLVPLLLQSVSTQRDSKVDESAFFRSDLNEKVDHSLEENILALKTLFPQFEIQVNIQQRKRDTNFHRCHKYRTNNAERLGNV